MNIIIRTVLSLIFILSLHTAIAQSYRPGQKVEVNYKGHWYKSTILQAEGNRRYKIHYEGYPESDDAWILASYIRTLGADEKPVTVNCSFTTPPGSYNNNSAASLGLFKRELHDWYQRLITGGVTSPTAIGIVFKTFVLQSSYKNTVSNVPGVGAMRKHSGAPANTMIYEVRTNYFVCEQYNSGVSQKEVNAVFSFFINKDGEWTCSKDS